MRRLRSVVVRIAPRVGLSLLALAWISPAPAQEAPPETSPGRADVAAYAAGLASVAEHLEAGRLVEARTEARALAPMEYDWAGETLAADSALLHEVSLVRSPGDARAAALRVRRVVAALGEASAGPSAATTAIDVDLATLAAEDTVKAGGTVERVSVAEISVPERIAKVILDTWDAFVSFLGELWDRLTEWLEKILPKKVKGKLPDGSTSPLAIAFVVAVAAALVVLSIRALRRRQKDAPSSTISGPQVSARDDDPLSRESNEWERHAQELGAAGRWREAIRAWYHAVLVALFRAGILHYRKGRTNWEYASRLAPEMPWRPAFFDLTRLFDREWYGRRTSDAEAHRACAREARGILESLDRSGGEP